MGKWIECHERDRDSEDSADDEVDDYFRDKQTT